MTKSWKSHGGIDGCRTFRNLYLSLPNARPVLVQVDLVQADVGATKWVAPSGPRRTKQIRNDSNRDQKAVETNFAACHARTTSPPSCPGQAEEGNEFVPLPALNLTFPSSNLHGGLLRSKGLERPSRRGSKHRQVQ